MKGLSFPLGIDIGSSRIRIACAKATEGGPLVSAIAVRDVAIGDDAGQSAAAAMLIEEMLDELATGERRCITALAEPDAWLNVIRAPRMTAWERDRWAQYEAKRLAPFSLDDATIRIHPTAQAATYALGAAKSSAVRRHLQILRAAKLKPVCIDYQAFALFRALPGFDAVLDIGLARTLLHIRVENGQMTLYAPCGGGDITQGIARDLQIDAAAAEKRKRILGTAGAGEHVRSAVASDIANLIREARSRLGVSNVRIAAVGNSARLPGLCADIAAKSEAVVESPVSAALQAVQAAPDVVRAAACDWTLSAGLALWGSQ
ncbi:MAG TPA: pilus assembly protein PilM [Candidatus Baltobacteraceae bacterium]|nr:pilus assembly protein PilM [Candidatus Baltobacteraceae bacterium]